MSLDPTLIACIPPNATTTCPSVVVKQAALDGTQWVSTVGSTLTYSSLDNPKSPHAGLRAELRQDVGTLPGTVDFVRTTGDVRYYHDLGNDVVGLVRVQGGYIMPYGGQTLPLMSSFFGGPQLVRGFAPMALVRATSPLARHRTISAAAVTGRPRRSCSLPYRGCRRRSR